MPWLGRHRTSALPDCRKSLSTGGDLIVTAGIIAEYHPFHNGHQYHIEETRRRTGADYVVAVISGDYVQRGTPAILDKYTRARMALEAGADLVLEMPVIGAVASAEGFARSGVSILHNLNVIDHLSFGCESDAKILNMISVLLSKETTSYQAQLLEYLKTGLSYPAARAKAICDQLGGQNKELEHTLTQPNNILAIEYLKCLHQLDSSISPLMIHRAGAGYHDSSLLENQEYASATAIRNYLNSGKYDSSCSLLEDCVPKQVYEALASAARNHLLVSPSADSSMLYYALTCKRNQTDSQKRSDLELRINRHLESFENREQFIELLKTKNQTYVGISRFLTEQLLGIDEELKTIANRCSYAPYVRILGFRKTAAPLLSSIKDRCSIPVVMHLAQDEKQLSEDTRRLLELDIHTADLYSRLVYEQSGQLQKSEYRRSLIYL